MASCTKALEKTLKMALNFVIQLSKYVSKLGGPDTTTQGGGIPPAEFLMLKASQEHAIASIYQELKGGGVTLGGHLFNGKDGCVAFAREHLSTDLIYHCIPSLMFALCMPSDKVVYKSDMQGDEIHATCMLCNPMQSAVVLSVNTIILPILEGLKDRIQELKFDFNAA